MLKISFLVLLISVTVTFFRWITKDPPEGTMSFPKLASFNGRAHVPLPRGGYVVGSTDGMTASNLLVRFYYPVEPASSPQDHTKHFDQWPPWIPALEVADGYLRFKMSRSVPFLARIFRWLIHDPLVPNVFGADMINQNKKMPVVIFSHGMGAIRTTYSTLLTEIASAGYFVAAVEHADGSASATINADGEWMYERKLLPDEDEYTVRNAQVGHRVEECESTFRLLQDMNNDAMQTKWASRFTPTESFLRSLVSRLDLEENVWISGHSFGGATAVKSLYTSRYQHQFLIFCPNVRSNFAGNPMAMQCSKEPSSWTRGCSRSARKLMTSSLLRDQSRPRRPFLSTARSFRASGTWTR